MKEFDAILVMMKKKQLSRMGADNFGLKYANT